MQRTLFRYILCVVEQSPPQGSPLHDNHCEDVAAIQQLAAIPSILEVVCRATGMGFAAVARVTDTRWIACAVRDEIDFGLEQGSELDVRTTICDEIRGHREAIMIENVAEDPIYRTHDTPRLYGFQSYISVPILRGDGEFFGTLFAMDFVPAKLANSSAATALGLFAELIGLLLDAARTAGATPPG